MADSSQKTEKPTDKRKRDSAEKGDVLQSRETAVALVTGAAMVWLFAMGPQAVQSLRLMVGEGLTLQQADIATFDPYDAITHLALMVAPMLLGLLVVTLIAAVASTALLGSFGFRTSAWAFKGERINPLAGLKRMFGMNGVIELGKSIAKVVALGAIGYWLVLAFLHSVTALGQLPFEVAITTIGHEMMIALLLATSGLFIIALIDAPVQFLRRMQRLMMSRQDIKDEHRQSEGAPEQKAAVRRRQHAVLNGSVRQAVAEATLVLTNPTHFAVALRYRPGMDAAPVVVARGRGVIAAAVRELADAASVPILSYPQLTRALYFTSRTGETIREDLYLAVATVLGFVLNVERAMSENAPPVEVPPGARFDAEGRLI